MAGQLRWRCQVRFIVDLDKTGNNVTGSVTCEGMDRPRSFSGWLELLSLLEVSPPADGSVEPAFT